MSNPAAQDPRPTGTSSSLPNPADPNPISRPSTGKRPRTAARRVRTARPDTSVSAIGPLPEQEFFPEGEDEDYDEEYLEDEEEEEGEDVFAFHRPQTAAVPGQAFSSADEQSAPPTGIMPTTAGTMMTDMSRQTGGTFGGHIDVPTSAPMQHNPSPIGAIDVGGHPPDREFDIKNPPPFSGRQNLNNSSFAFSMPHNRSYDSQAAASRAGQTNTGQSLVSRARRMMGTGMTSSRMSYDSSRDSTHPAEDQSSYGEGSNGRPSARRMKSSAPLIEDSEIGSKSSNRGQSRHSYGLTELTGEITVPDGRTTYGDGLGGVVKEGASEEGSMGAIDVDLLEEDSPYEEVRASVSNIDDPEMPALTLRAWGLGMFLAIVICAANTFFNFRNPAPAIPVLFVQVAAYPLGKFVAWALPIRSFTVPRWLGGFTFSLNPCPFNIKEHTIIVMMANISIAAPYALYTITASNKFYERPLGSGFNILFILATQLTGMSMAGMVRRLVVWPASMLWPGVLVVTTNLNTLHAEPDSGSGGISRLRFFMYAMCAAFGWYFIPGFLFTALSYFSWVCWIAPNNPVVNQLFGVSTGLGMGLFSFDWSQISWIGSPLTTPWWAEVNVGIGFLLFYWIIVPILYYTNVWWLAYLPMSAAQIADRFQDTYEVSYILTPDFELNKTAYALYSPVYLTATFAMTYMLGFALITTLLVHTALYHGPRIYKAVLRMKTEKDDIHMKLMRQYPEVPDWWYLITLVLCLVFGILSIEIFHTGLPVWGYLVATLIAGVYIVPSAFIYALTAIQPNINILSELIPGYIFAGKPIAGMVFKSFTVQSLTEAMSFSSAMKLGHYMKIPPRSMYFAQFSACFVACFVQFGVSKWMFDSIPDLCSSHQKNLLTCSNAQTFFTASVVWGLVGPDRIFGTGGLYHPILWMFLAGALAPIPFWLYCRRYPKSFLRNFNLPVVLSGPLSIPPATGYNYASWLLVGFVFQYWIRRRAFAWWSKYNYVLSAALDVGTIASAIFIFLVLGLPQVSLNWWGNTVMENTLDWNGIPYYIAGETGFGPSTWKV